jgi:hypothetical protein
VFRFYFAPALTREEQRSIDAALLSMPVPLVLLLLATLLSP